MSEHLSLIVRQCVIGAVVDTLNEHEPCVPHDEHDAATTRVGEEIADRAAKRVVHAIGLTPAVVAGLDSIAACFSSPLFYGGGSSESDQRAALNWISALAGTFA